MDSRTCMHSCLRFGSGGFLLLCDLCGSSWAATDPTGKPDYARSTVLSTGGVMQYRASRNEATRVRLWLSKTI